MKKKTVVNVASGPQKEVVLDQVHEMEKEKHFDPGAVKEETIVHHNNFGAGTVRNIDDGKIYVEFG